MFSILADWTNQVRACIMLRVSFNEEAFVTASTLVKASGEMLQCRACFAGTSCRANPLAQIHRGAFVVLERVER